MFYLKYYPFYPFHLLLQIIIIISFPPSSLRHPNLLVFRYGWNIAFNKGSAPKTNALWVNETGNYVGIAFRPRHITHFAESINLLLLQLLAPDGFPRVGDDPLFGNTFPSTSHLSIQPSLHIYPSNHHFTSIHPTTTSHLSIQSLLVSPTLSTNLQILQRVQLVQNVPFSPPVFISRPFSRHSGFHPTRDASTSTAGTCTPASLL